MATELSDYSKTCMYIQSLTFIIYFLKFYRKLYQTIYAVK